MLKQLARSARGSTIFEFALVFPILMTLGFAVWEFGRLTDALIITTNAAREGARYAAAHGSDSSLVQDTQNDVYAYLQSSFGANRLGANGDIGITASQVAVQFFTPSGAADSGPSPGDQVTVTVPIQATVFTPFVPGLSNSKTLTGVSTMRIQ